MWENRQEWLGHLEALRIVKHLCNSLETEAEVRQAIWEEYLKSLDRVQIEVLEESAFSVTWTTVVAEPANTLADMLALLDEHRMTFDCLREFLNRCWTKLTGER